MKIIARSKRKIGYVIRPLKMSGLTFKNVRKLGYNVSRDLWKTCSDMNQRNGGDFIFNLNFR